MGDADDDAKHIICLLINLFYTFWPNLYKNGYIETMITPVIQLFKTSDKKMQTPIEQFYNHN